MKIKSNLSLHLQQRAIQFFAFFHVTFLTLIYVVSPAWCQAATPNSQGLSDTRNASIAAENERVQQRLKAIHDIKSVTLIFAEPFRTEPPMSEYALTSRGCSYDVYDPHEVSEIFESIKAENIRFDKSSIASVAFLNGAIFKGSDGSEQKFFFDYRNSQDKTIQGYFNNQSVSANVGLIKKLYSAALKTKINKHCNKFIEFYKDK